MVLGVVLILNWKLEALPWKTQASKENIQVRPQETMSSHGRTIGCVATGSFSVDRTESIFFSESNESSIPNQSICSNPRIIQKRLLPKTRMQTAHLGRRTSIPQGSVERLLRSLGSEVLLDQLHSDSLLGGACPRNTHVGFA
jgi:hypothetical protein